MNSGIFTNTQLILLVCLIMCLFVFATTNFTQGKEQNYDRIFSEDGWWELQKTNHRIFSGRDLRSRSIFIRKVDADDNLLHTCYQYNVINSRNKEVFRSGQFCYPAIIITGIRKCSTSAAYALVSDVPGSIQLKFKENCPFIGWRSIVDYFESMPQHVGPGGLVIDGCVDLIGNMKMRQLLRQPATFYVIVLRDFSDWIWSAYNYWCNAAYDVGCDADSRWTKIGRHNRSAEMFSKIVQASVEGHPIASPLNFNNTCDKAHHFYRSYYNDLRAGGVHSDSIAVLAAEQLETASEQFWDRLSTAAGLPKKHPGIDKFKKFRYNVQNINVKFRKGDHPERSKIEASDHKPGLYEISQFQPLMKSTRAMLDKCWRDDCIWASNITQHRYAACVGEGESIHETQEVQNVTSVPGGLFTGFLNHRVRQCHQLITDSGYLARFDSVKGNSISMHSVLILSPQPRLGELVMRLLNAVFLSDPMAFFRTEEIGAEKGAEHCGSKLGHLTVVLASMIDVESIDIIEDNGEAWNHSRKLITEWSSVFGRERSGSPDLTAGFKEDSSNSSSTATAKYIAHFKNGTTTCERSNASFDRVVLLEDDPFVQIWDDFVARQGDAEPEYLRTNWTLWDEVSLTAPVIKLSDRVSKDIKAEDSMVLQFDLLIDGQNKVEALRLLLHFLGFKSPPEDLLRCAYAVCMAMLRTNHELIPELLERHRALQAKKEVVYSSNAMVCRRQHLSSLGYDPPARQQASLYADVNCTQPTAPSNHSTRGCDIRYAQSRSFLAWKDRREQPVALVAMQSPKVTNTRLLVEYSTGFFTGAIRPNGPQAVTFRGEYNCSQHVPLIYTHPNQLLCKMGKKTNAPEIVMKREAWRNCVKGKIERFAKFVILIEDPFAMIWKDLHITSEQANKVREDDFNHTTDGQGGNSTMLANLLQRAVDLTKEYTSSLQNLLGNEIAVAIVEKFPPSSYLVMSYGYLINLETRQHALQQLLEFANVSMFPSSTECLQCSFALIPGIEEQHIRVLSAAVRGLRQHRHFLCAIKQEFKASNMTQFLGNSLLSEETCSHQQVFIGTGKRSWVR